MTEPQRSGHARRCRTPLRLRPVDWQSSWRPRFVTGRPDPRRYGRSHAARVHVVLRARGLRVAWRRIACHHRPNRPRPHRTGRHGGNRPGSYAADTAVKRALAVMWAPARSAAWVHRTSAGGLCAGQVLRWAVVVEDPTTRAERPRGGVDGPVGAIGALVVILALGTAVFCGGCWRHWPASVTKPPRCSAAWGKASPRVDADGKVLKINPALERMVGKKSALVEHQPWESTFVLRDERAMAVAWEDTVVAEAIRSRHVVASRGYGLGSRRPTDDAYRWRSPPHPSSSTPRHPPARS